MKYNALIAAAVAAASKDKQQKSFQMESLDTALKVVSQQDRALATEAAQLTDAQRAMLFASLSTESFKAEKDSSSYAKGEHAAQDGGVSAPLEKYNSLVHTTMESFAAQNKANVYDAINANLNVGLAIQDKFGECFYPTTPIRQEEAGKVYEVAVPYRYDGVMASDFSPAKFFDKAVNLIDAMYNPDVVSGSATRLIPNKTPTKLNVDISASLATDSISVYMPGQTGGKMLVKPILSGRPVNFFDADANVASPAVEEYLDHISPGMLVEKLFFKAAFPFAGGDAPVGFTIDTRNVAGSQIVKNQTGGNEYDYVLNLKGRHILSAATPDIAGTFQFDAPILDNDVYVEIEYTASGNLNLRDREVTITVGNLVVKKAYRANALGVVTEIALNSAIVGADIAKVVTYVANINAATGIRAYWPMATRANSVGRVAGILVDYKLARWSAAVDFGSPISTLSSLLESDATSLNYKVDTMRQAGYANICGQGVQRLLETADILKERYGVAGTPQLVRTRTDFGLPSSHFTMPYFKEVTLDATTIVNSIKSSEKMADIQAALLNYLRQEAYDLIRNSRIRAAYMILFPNKKINVKIGTDSVISRYLIQQGDVRTLGDDVDCEIVQTDNLGMKNKIIITVGVRSEESSPDDFLSFGKHFIAPETIVEIKDSLASTFGGVSRTMYFPRNRHVTMLNVMTVINVDEAKFKDAIALQTAYVTTP